MTLQAVLFDFDGTLTRPGILDFAAIRQDIKCPVGTPLLEYIEALPHGNEHTQAVSILESYEAHAAESSQPHNGAEEIVVFLSSLSLKLGIITRNSLKSVKMALEKFKQVSYSDFNVVITRDDKASPKPDPAGILLAARRMKVPVDRMLVVGDYVFDVEAGRRAGALTVFLDNGTITQDHTPLADFTIKNLDELKGIVANLHISPVKLRDFIKGRKDDR